jgi:hypothetical protein
LAGGNATRFLIVFAEGAHLLARQESGLPLARSSIKLHLLKICVKVLGISFSLRAVCHLRTASSAWAGEIAWPRPTRPGDILHVESEIVEITPSRSKPHQGIITVRGTMFNRNREAVYLLTAKLLVLRRPQ